MPTSARSCSAGSGALSRLCLGEFLRSAVCGCLRCGACEPAPPPHPQAFARSDEITSAQADLISCIGSQAPRTAQILHGTECGWVRATALSGAATGVLYCEIKQGLQLGSALSQWPPWRHLPPKGHGRHYV